LLEFRNDNISSEVAVHRKRYPPRSSFHLNFRLGKHVVVTGKQGIFLSIDFAKSLK
jgi:hypothetical protein